MRFKTLRWWCDRPRRPDSGFTGRFKHQPLRNTNVLSRIWSHDIKPMDSRPGQGANHSDTLCDREVVRRSHGGEGAVSCASCLRDRALAAGQRRTAPFEKGFFGPCGLLQSTCAVLVDMVVLCAMPLVANRSAATGPCRLSTPMGLPTVSWNESCMMRIAPHPGDNPCSPPQSARS
jgi:hypothetical protein